MFGVVSSKSLSRADHSSGEVLSSIACTCVTECDQEALARLGLLRHAEKDMMMMMMILPCLNYGSKYGHGEKRCRSMRSCVARFTVRTVYRCGESLPLLNGSQLDSRSV